MLVLPVDSVDIDWLVLMSVRLTYFSCFMMMTDHYQTGWVQVHTADRPDTTFL